MGNRVYVTVAELLAEVDSLGRRDEASLFRAVEAASTWIDRKIGWFIPTTETRRYDGNGEKHLFIDPLLSATTVTNDGTTITAANYLLYPRNKHWENGPYSRISVDPDATLFSYWKKERDAVTIAGTWGLYSESKATGATVQNVTEITAAGTSLLVSNGALLSPGMVLLIESEQLLVTATGTTKTDTTTNTAEALDTSEEAVDVGDGTTVNIGEVVQVDNEKMLVLGINTNTLIVERGYMGTEKTTHDNAADVYAYRTYTVERGVNGTTAATHANATAISRYVPPADVRYLALQIAALMLKKAEAGFAGKTGSPELGEVFYHVEVPRDYYKDIKNAYRIRGGL